MIYVNCDICGRQCGEHFYTVTINAPQVEPFHICERDECLENYLAARQRAQGPRVAGSSPFPVPHVHDGYPLDAEERRITEGVANCPNADGIPICGPVSDCPHTDHLGRRLAHREPPAPKGERQANG